MRLKKLKKETRVRIKNKHEYLLLMSLLEKAGYKWATDDLPTEYNNAPIFYNTKCIVLYPEDKIIMASLSHIGIPIRKVIKYGVGDKVRIREDIASCKEAERVAITEKMKEFAGQVSTITYIDRDGNFCLKCGYTWKKKWLEPVFENTETDKKIEDEVDWSKVAVDTPILVNDWSGWVKRHFAKYENGKVYAYVDGRTSFTSKTRPFGWNRAKLADIGEYHD